LHAQLLPDVGFLVLNSLLFQQNQVVSLFRSEVGFVVLPLSSIELSLFCISVLDLHLDKLEVIEVIVSSQLFRMVSDHILLIFGHFKLFSLKLPDMFYLLKLILKPFLSLLINMLDILDTFSSLCSGMIINSIWPVRSQK